MAISLPLRAEAIRSLGVPRLVVLSTFVAITLAGGLLALSRSPLLEVRSIRVAGTDVIAAETVRSLANVRRGEAILWLDPAAIEERVAEHPWIARATVVRSLPWTLSVEVEERRPVAVVRVQDGDLLVAGDGTMLGPAPRGTDLPRIVLPAVQLARGQRTVPVASLALVVRGLPARLRGDVSTVALDADGGVLMRIAGGGLVEFGAPEDVDPKVRALVEVLRWARREGISLRTVSVVSPAAPAVSLSR